MIAATQTRVHERESLLKLKTALYRRVVDAVDLSQPAALETKELRAQLTALAHHLCSREPAVVPVEIRDSLVGEVLDEIYGYGPLEPLMNDSEVTDILVSGPKSVWVERNGCLEETDQRFADNTHLLRLIRRLVEQAGQRIDVDSPMVDAQLPDGSRLTAVIPPLAAHWPTLSIRRLNASLLRLEEMVRRGTLAPEMAAFLIAAVRGRLNILVSGGTGSGKTTFLNNLCHYIPQTERIIAIEPIAELRFEQTGVLSLQTLGSANRTSSALDLVENCLRMRPDRIVIGEARGAEVFCLLQAMATGQEGSLATVHANDTQDALARIELMVALSGAGLSPLAARRYIASAVKILVHVERLPSGERKVVKISELRGFAEGAFQIEDIFVCRMAGFDDHGHALGAFYSTGYEPESLTRLAALGTEIPRDLFVPRELCVGEQYAFSE